MANWSYNGVILPDFPTDWGPYSDQYGCRAIVWEERRQRWYALASAKPFVADIGVDNRAGLVGLFATDYHGQYYHPLDGTEWIHVGSHYDDGDMLYFGTSSGYQMIWANHDIINRADGTLFWAGSDPVSPDAAVTAVTVFPMELTLSRGESAQLTAKVEGTGVYSEWVSWSLHGTHPDGGTILTPDGLLTVGEEECVPAFTVTAASRQDPAVKGAAAVTVADYRSKLSLEVVSDLYDYNGTVLADFPPDWDAAPEGFAHRVILWEERNRRWYALASAAPFEVAAESGGTLLELYATGEHVQAYHPADGTAWVCMDNRYGSGRLLTFGDENGYRMVWASHDILHRADGSVFQAAGEPVRLCWPLHGGEETVYHVTGPNVWLDAACSRLNETDAVYTVKLWLYRLVDGLNTRLPPTWTSEVFGGPDWAQRISLSDLLPFTRYGVYGAVCVDGAATDHFCSAFFTTLQTDLTTGLSVVEKSVRPEGFTLSVTCWGLKAGVKHLAEILVYHPDTLQVVCEGEISFWGSGTNLFVARGLEPDTRYAVSVDLYPAPAGAVVVRGDYYFATAPEPPLFGIYAGVDGVARPVRQIYAGVDGCARKVTEVYLGVNGKAQPL